MPQLTRPSENELLQQIEALRRELDEILQQSPELLGSQQVYALSSRLDILIATYMRSKAQPNSPKK
ncbi:MAG: aspartyl-phosphate phosphatase Spo0E family protein [Firmicutes bacterium]|nr:aspartyl-phosphate phosphatase Spo0E family protein [Bacillota bacterium]